MKLIYIYIFEVKTEIKLKYTVDENAKATFLNFI